MMAQSNIKQGRLLQNVNSYVTPQRSFNNNISNPKYNSYFKIELKNTGTNKVRSNTAAKIKSDVLNKSSFEDKLNSLTEASQQKHKNPRNTINNAVENSETLNNKKSIENTTAIIANFSNKKNKSGLRSCNKNNQKQTIDYSKSSDIISINLPDSYKSQSYQNLSIGNSLQTNNQIIVSEKQADMIVNQVKEQMRGKDPENMYIKCPLCEKRIKRFNMSIHN